MFGFKSSLLLLNVLNISYLFSFGGFCEASGPTREDFYNYSDFCLRRLLIVKCMDLLDDNEDLKKFSFVYGDSTDSKIDALLAMTILIPDLKLKNEDNRFIDRFTFDTIHGLYYALLKNTKIEWRYERIAKLLFIISAIDTFSGEDPQKYFSENYENYMKREQIDFNMISNVSPLFNRVEDVLYLTNIPPSIKARRFLVYANLIYEFYTKKHMEVDYDYIEALTNSNFILKVLVELVDKHFPDLDYDLYPKNDYPLLRIILDDPLEYLLRQEKFYEHWVIIYHDVTLYLLMSYLKMAGLVDITDEECLKGFIFGLIEILMNSDERITKWKQIGWDRIVSLFKRLHKSRIAILMKYVNGREGVPKDLDRDYGSNLRYYGYNRSDNGKYLNDGTRVIVKIIRRLNREYRAICGHFETLQMDV